MNIFDLTHKLHNHMPIFPGTSKPQFKPVATIKTEGYCETHFEFNSHLGTHIDAPAHIFEAGQTLDQLPVSNFAGKAIIIKIPVNITHIKKSLFDPFKEKLAKTDFVLFKTGWHKKWGSDKYFSDFPILTEDTAQWLNSFKLKGIGIDAISVDPVKSTDLPIHHIILSQGFIIIENLNFPEMLTAIEGEFSCFPLLYENADGSPVRAVLKIK